MFIYLLFIIPIVFTIVMLYKFKHEVVWWEYLLSFGITIICIVSSKAVIESIQVTDTEYWGGWVTEVRYYEDWNEYIQRTCSRQYACGSDSKGNTKYCTEYYDCSYVEYHDEYWNLRGSNGESINISLSQYNKLVSQFGTGKRFVDLRRNYHTNDGDMYRTRWSGELAKLEPLITKHSYENRPRVSSSAYAQAEPSVEIFQQYKLYHYPNVYEWYKQKAILGYDDPKAEKQFQILNARYGSKYEFKSFVTVFKNLPRESGMYQEQQWQGGNKNELNFAIGIDDQGNVKWCHIFSWTEKLDIVVGARQLVEEQDKLDLNELASYLAINVPKKWKRKHFSDFSYLTVEPKTKHIIWSFIITLIVNIAVGVFVVKNDITENNRRR